MGRVKSSLAEFYANKNQYNKTLELQEQIIASYKSEVGETNWNYFNTIFYYSVYLDLAGRKKEALENGKKSIEILQELIARDLLFLSKKESEQYWKTHGQSIKTLLRMAMI